MFTDIYPRRDFHVVVKDTANVWRSGVRFPGLSNRTQCYQLASGSPPLRRFFGAVLPGARFGDGPCHSLHASLQYGDNKKDLI